MEQKDVAYYLHMTWKMTLRKDNLLLVLYFGYKATESELNPDLSLMVKCLGLLFTKHVLVGLQLRGVMLIPALTC